MSMQQGMQPRVHEGTGERAARVRVEPEPLAGLPAALAAVGIREGEPPTALVYAPGRPEDWPGVEARLVESFRLTKAVAAAGGAVVYLLPQADLLGQGGAAPAMLANALLSGARALAMEGRKRGVRANVLAYGEAPDVEALARWVATLLDDDSVTGEVIRLGGEHLGKVIP